VIERKEKILRIEIFFIVSAATSCWNNAVAVTTFVFSDQQTDRWFLSARHLAPAKHQSALAAD